MGRSAAFSTQLKFKFARRAWYDTSEWFKAATISGFGRIPGSFE
jgi:hypothetical protein